MSGRPARQRSKVNYAAYFEKASDESSDPEEEEEVVEEPSDDFEPEQEGSGRKVGCVFSL